MRLNLIRMPGRFPHNTRCDANAATARVPRNRPVLSGTFSAAATDMALASQLLATIRMQVQVSAAICELQRLLSRLFMASLDSVSIAILLGAVLVMAGILSSLLALRFGAPLLLVFLLVGMVAGDAGPGQLQLRRRAYHLSGGLGGAGADPVRWRPEDPLPEHPRGARAVDGAGDRRRAVDGADHGAGRQICARPELDRSAAGRRRGRLDRCGGGVPAGACAGLAAAPARRRDAGGRIRHQRSLRGVSDPDAGRADLERQQFGLARAARIRAGGRAGRHRRRGRRQARGAGAQSRRAAAGPACAVRHHGGAGDLRRRADRACLGVPRGLSRRHHHRQPADARA